jgi:hypothetical protein
MGMSECETEAQVFTIWRLVTRLARHAPPYNRSVTPHPVPLLSSLSNPAPASRGAVALRKAPMSNSTSAPTGDPSTISAPLETTTGLHLAGPLGPESAPRARDEITAVISKGHPRLIRDLYAYQQQRLAPRRQHPLPTGPS